MKKVPVQSNQTQKLKKHRRIKSQELIYSPSNQMPLYKKPSLHNFFQIPNINKNLQISYVIQVIKQGGCSIKLVFSSESPLKLVKEQILKKLGILKNSAYFYTMNQDYNFDYRFQEEIGTLDANRKLSLFLIPKQYQQILHKNEEIKQSSKINQYFVYDCLSVGGFSKVFLTRSKNSGKFYAAKFIDKNLDDSTKFTQLIFNEKFINQMLDYPMLVKMHQFLQTKQFYVFILDYCPSGQLFSLMKNHRDMTEDQARFYFLQTILGIQHMHSKSIIYRDIKPQNILLDKNGHIKIADFGLSKIMREKSLSYCGSLQYMAPQIVSGHQHSFGVDHYCLGSLLFQMMVGCPPFYNPNFTPSQTKYHIINSQVRFPPKRYFSIQLIDFVNKLLDKNPKTRLGSLGGIKQILSHPWIGKFDRQKYENYQMTPPFIVSLNESNFQTTYLPKQSIKQTKQKISVELQERQSKSKGFKKQKLNKFQDQFSDKLIKKRMKSNQIEIEPGHHKKNISKRKFSTGVSLYSKDEQELNPYDILLSKNRSTSKKQSFSSSKNAAKSQSKSLHLKTDQNKNQCETKFNGNERNHSNSNSNVGNVGKQLKLSQAKKQLQKFRKCTENTDELKRKKRKQINGNENKQNDDQNGNLNRFKFKYQNFKDKSIRKLFGDFMRYTCTNDTQNNEDNRNNRMWKFNRAIGDAFPKRN